MRSSKLSVLLSAALLVGLLGGCRRRPAPAPKPNQPKAAFDWSPPPPAAVTPAASSPSAPAKARSPRLRREACEFTAGALPEQTVDDGDPIGQRIPIDHFIIVMQENRSFDEYFAGLPKFGQPAADVAPADFHNPDPKTGKDVTAFHATALCGKDTRHDWNSAHTQYNDGKMDGFIATSNPKGTRALAYYDATDLGYYYALANTFAIGDRYFASILGPTWPNRMFFHSASTFGHIGNSAPPAEADEPSLFHQLQQKGVEWIIYAEGMTFEEKIFRHLHDEKGDHFKDLDAFFVDAKRGTLPAYVWLESSYGGPDATDEHPPADIQLGQKFVSRLIDALMHGPQWAHSALFITYDEPGGFFDHVPPPPACLPDHIEPLLEKRHVRARFDRLGMRVPFIVVSPFAKAHYVSHQIFSHNSLSRLVQARFELPALSARDANSSIPYDLFDFQHPPFATPPALPEAVVDEAAHLVCRAKFRKKKQPGKTVDVPDYGKDPKAEPVPDPEGPEPE